jgi:hypothetical protein
VDRSKQHPSLSALPHRGKTTLASCVLVLLTFESGGVQTVLTYRCRKNTDS